MLVLVGYGIATAHICHTLLVAKIPTSEMTKIVKRVHCAHVVFPVTATAALGFFAAAWLAKDLPSQFITPLGLHVSTQFALAGATLVAIVPYSWIAVRPGVKRIKGNMDSNGEVVNERVWIEDITVTSRRGVWRLALWAGALFLGLTI